MVRFALIVASTLGFFLTAAFGSLLVPLFRILTREVELSRQEQNHRSGQSPAAELPENLLRPTMGGIFYIVGTLIAVAVAWMGVRRIEPELLLNDESPARIITVILGGAFAFGVIGFLDDVTKVKRNQTVGLKRGVRLFLEMAVSFGVVIALRRLALLSSVVVLPRLGVMELERGGSLLWMLLLVVLAESARLSDNIGGVCCGVAFVQTAALMSTMTALNLFTASIVPAALAGGLLAFLLWNFPPAVIKCGSLGCLFLAGFLGVLPLAVGQGWMLPILILPWFLQGGMVLLQVIFYRLTRGKLLFETAPLDVWLVRKGWSRAWVCFAFYAVALGGNALLLWLSRGL